jgi:hypothetical protein
MASADQASTYLLLFIWVFKDAIAHWLERSDYLNEPSGKQGI